MSDPLHHAEDIAAEIKRRLLTRTIALGAETDLGAAVYQGRRSIDKEQIPCCVVIEGDDVPERATVTTSYNVVQRYVLLAYVPCTLDDPNLAAHAAIRDMKRAIFLTDGKPDPRWGRTVKDVTYVGRDIGPRADGEKFVLAIIEITVQYVEDLAAP